MNVILTNWVSQGIGKPRVVLQLNMDDEPALKAIFENTLDAVEKTKAKNVLAHLVKDGTAYLDIEEVGYYGKGLWKKT